MGKKEDLEKRHDYIRRREIATKSKTLSFGNFLANTLLPGIKFHKTYFDERENITSYLAEADRDFKEKAYSETIDSLSRALNNVQGLRNAPLEEYRKYVDAIDRRVERVYDKVMGLEKTGSRLTSKLKKLVDSVEISKHYVETRNLRLGPAAVSIVGLLGGLFFISSNLTGNVIGSMSQTSSNWVGGALFVIGLVSALLYFRRK